MPPRVHIGEQICLRPKPEQADIIWEAVKDHGLSPDSNGVLNLLLLLLCEDDDDAKPENAGLESVVQYFRDNPDKLKKTMDTASKVGKFFLSALK